MAGATTTTFAEAIQTHFVPGMRKTFYEGTPLMNLIGVTPSEGGNSTDWKLNYSGNTGYLYNEGDGAPAAGNLEYADMTVTPFSVQSTVQISGHAQDALKGGYFDAAMKEMEGGASAVMHKAEEKCVSLYEAAVNDDTNYAGKARATVHADSHVVAGGSAANSLANLSECYETLQLDPRGVVFNNPREWAILSSPEQATAYTEIASGIIVTGDAEAAGANLPYNTAQTDAVMDAGRMKHTLEYNKIPWFSIPTLTNTLVTFTRLSDVLIEEFRPLTISPLAKTDDTDKWLFTWRGNLVHLDPYRAARIEDLTT